MVSEAGKFSENPFRSESLFRFPAGDVIGGQWPGKFGLKFMEVSGGTQEYFLLLSLYATSMSEP